MFLTHAHGATVTPAMLDTDRRRALRLQAQSLARRLRGKPATAQRRDVWLERLLPPAIWSLSAK